MQCKFISGACALNKKQGNLLTQNYRSKFTGYETFYAIPPERSSDLFSTLSKHRAAAPHFHARRPGLEKKHVLALSHHSPAHA